MRKAIAAGLLALGFLSSCSNDGGGSEPPSIIGTWDAVELQLDANTATQDELLASDFLRILAARNCYILALTFEANGEATAENSFDYLDLSGLAVGNFDIPCPTQADADSGTYTYENGVVTITDAAGATSSVNVTLSGNLLTMDLEGSVFADQISGGQLVFRKR
ncbi:lipocalin family protein [Robiginitalea sp. M366]|uniref:lipocalin family protein n=1 Tax=Robiginitalea aestuariiviva TaxID=3036903 RepID=UPI00240DCF3A|nr:lipocalin family protein [Robiginitalea aestuariiviva]MDG1571043.1 lipocalin family protein [Robiginitalea aestuariiviva]